MLGHSQKLTLTVQREQCYSQEPSPAETKRKTKVTIEMNLSAANDFQSASQCAFLPSNRPIAESETTKPSRHYSRKAKLQICDNLI